MREAIGSSLLFNIVITIIIVMIAVLVSSLAYSKAFKVKNRIINMLETRKGYDQNLKSEIDGELANMGYKVSNKNTCKKIEAATLLTNDSLGTTYDYCIYEIKTCENTEEENKSCNSYYKVITYMYFDIPVIGQLLKFPVSGETKVMYDTYINYE